MKHPIKYKLARFYFKWELLTYIVIAISLVACKNPTTSSQTIINENEFIVELPQVSYPLPVVDHILNNCDVEKKHSMEDNPIVYILRGINDIWKRTTDTYQSSSSIYGPGMDDLLNSNPIIDPVIWKENMEYVLKVTGNRTDDEAILAYLDDVRSKYYSVIDGFGPLTEDYVKYSGAYVDLPIITVDQVLKDTNYQSEYNNSSQFAGFETSRLGAVVRLARAIQRGCSSTKAPKHLYSTPRPWRMNDTGVVNFLGTTYDTTIHSPTYSCINSKGEEKLKIFDIYECNVKVVPGLKCSRKDHKYIYDDNNSSSADFYTNTSENIRMDNGYPSGHTNAGVFISLVYAYAFPERFTELVLRGAQLGEDRIIAGMHSPVDNIGGKIMALSVVCANLNKPEVAKVAEEALRSTLDVFGAKADNANMSLYDYAHRKVDNPTGYIIGNNINVQVFNNNIYDDKAKAKKIYRERLTYGFTQDKTKANLPPIVPKGAEVILKSRFPYLSDNQRRGVLYTTEIPSGYKILDKTNGWGRIDLVTAADGYGSFIGDVHVNMDSSLGRFNALDSWGNDIDGKGRLIKDGTGKLILTGNNSYSGGTIIKGGTLTTTSQTALGAGDVFIQDNGTLEVNHALDIKGKFAQDGGNISVRVVSDTIPLITVNKKIELQSSTIVVGFDNQMHPKTGDKFAIIQGDELLGNFERIEAEGYSCVTEKVGNTIYILIN